MDIADEVVEFVRRRPGTSFVELEDFLRAKGVSVDGDEAVTISKFGLVMWAGMSAEFQALILGLVHKRIHPHPTSVLTYMIDGKVLKFPVAKNVRHYKTPHWVPVAFSVVAEGLKRVPED